MEPLTPREKKVLSEMMLFAKHHGRWGTIREIGVALAEREGLETLSVASAFRGLISKRAITKDGSNYAVAGYAVKVKKAELIKVKASRDALAGVR